METITASSTVRQLAVRIEETAYLREATAFLEAEVLMSILDMEYYNNMKYIKAIDLF
jgi:hypothetical protein